MLAATWQQQQLQMGRLGPSDAAAWGLQQVMQQQQLHAWLPPHHSVGVRAGGGHLQQTHHHQPLQQGHGPGLGQAGLQRTPHSGTKHLGGLPQLKRAGQAGQHWRARPCAPSAPAVSPPSSSCDQDSAAGTTEVAEEASEAGPGPQDASQAATGDDGQSSGASTSGRGPGEQCREAGDQWEWLTEGLLKEVMGHLHPHSLRRMRLVCQRWRRVVDSHVQVGWGPGASACAMWCRAARMLAGGGDPLPPLTAGTAVGTHVSIYVEQLCLLALQAACSLRAWTAGVL